MDGDQSALHTEVVRDELHTVTDHDVNSMHVEGDPVIEKASDME